MSTNIYFYGTREVQVVKTGKMDIQTVDIWALQTPTTASYLIYNSPDPVGMYVEWIKSQFKDEIVPIFAEDDIWDEGEPVGHKTVNRGKEIVDEFMKTVRELQEDGYEVKCSLS